MVFNGRLLIFEERNHMKFEELLLFDFNGKSEHFVKYLTQTPVVSNDMPFANFMFSTRNHIVLCSMDKESGCAITKGKSLPKKRIFFQNRCTFSDYLIILISTLTEKKYRFDLFMKTQRSLFIFLTYFCVLSVYCRDTLEGEISKAQAIRNKYQLRKSEKALFRSYTENLQNIGRLKQMKKIL